MDYLPIFLRLEGRSVAVVGGGGVALRKVTTLREAGAHVSVIAPVLEPQLGEQAARGEVRHIAASFVPAHLDGAQVAIAATNDTQVNRAVSAAARARGIPVNVVDDAELSTFIFPAIIDRSPVLVAVSSAGRAPVLARRIRAQLEALLPARLGALARFMGERRGAVRQALAAPARRRLWERIVSGPVATRVLGGDEAGAEHALTRELLAARLSIPAAATGAGDRLGEVYLIGAGPGDPDLLTLRALQLLQQADVILYDRLVSPQVLDRARRDAERIFVGKTAGEPGQQERINELLLQHALAGRRVARLKGGDPLIFGRGGEELEALAAHDIPCTIVPGITAALGAAASAGVPLTHRRLAHSVTFVNGHHGESDAEPDWRNLADPQHTGVFYMGLAHLAGIVARLRAAGAAAGHPAVLIARATLPGQQTVRGTLADIVARVRSLEIDPPALLITGNVAAFDAETAGTVAALPGLGVPAPQTARPAEIAARALA
ncbi:MAG: uroporphyrinogen-III C-methyltransferase [Gammaproteobacteria bacterium]|nr:uroporphyrinogen-III C-methyltransferase [Gammaproteobacteria bacterium]